MTSKEQRIFDNNPKLKTLYKAEGKNIYFTESQGAEEYKDSEKVELTVINRDEDTQEIVLTVELPEGEPTTDWTIPQIQDWLTDRNVKFNKQAKEANLLEKVNDFLKSQED